MMPNPNQLLPITPWPTEALGPVLVHRPVLKIGERGTLRWRWESPIPEPARLPAEWGLRELVDATLDDDEEVAALLIQRGVISRPFVYPGDIPQSRREFLAPISEEHGWQHRRDWEYRADGTLEDARWWLKMARALSLMWANASIGDTAAAVAAWSEEGFSSQDEEGIWVHFTLALNHGLNPFHARVEHVAPIVLSDEPYVWGGLPRVDLYSAACCQIFDFIAGREIARRCENTSCGRLFVHQLGGAEFGQYHSMGMRFCSPGCGQAERQRQYRRRQKEQKASNP
jgi:hypothetical protein